MIKLVTLAQQTRVQWTRGGRLIQLLAALAVGALLAVGTWKAGLLDVATFDDLQRSVAGSASSPTSTVAVGAAFLIGAITIVLPCGYPSVFAVPSILTSREGLPRRAVLGLLFLLGSALPLALFGVALSLVGSGVLDLLATKSAKLGFASILYSAIGFVAVGYALSEFGFFRLPSLTARITGPNLPDREKPYGRALVLGATFGGGMGIGCPMPTYYVLLGWVVATAQPLYGAALLGAYGLGRLVPAVAIGALITAGADRRNVSRSMTAFRERTHSLTSAMLAAMGAYLIVLFGAVVGSESFL